MESAKESEEHGSLDQLNSADRQQKDPTQEKAQKDEESKGISDIEDQERETAHPMHERTSQGPRNPLGTSKPPENKRKTLVNLHKVADTEIQEEDLKGALVNFQGKRSRQEQKAFIRDLLEARKESIQELSDKMKHYLTIDDFEVNKPDKIEREQRETQDSVKKSVCFGDVIVLKVNISEGEVNKDAKITSF